MPDVDDPRLPLSDAALGWIHGGFATEGASTTARLHIGANAFEPSEPLNASVWPFHAPFIGHDVIEILELEPYIEFFGAARGNGGGLVVSSYCRGQRPSPAVRKTASATFDGEDDRLIDSCADTENG